MTRPVSGWVTRYRLPVTRKRVEESPGKRPARLNNGNGIDTRDATGDGRRATYNPPMRRSATIGGVVVGVAAAAVAMVWLLKDRILGPETTPVTPEEAPRFRVVPPASGRAKGAADDLTAVKGIGPVYRARLIEGGITTFAALAKAKPARIAEIAEIGEDTAADWAKQASALVE